MKDFKNVTFKISDDIALSELNDESIALNLDSGKYFQLNELATFIFKNLENFTSIDNLKRMFLKNLMFHMKIARLIFLTSLQS